MGCYLGVLGLRVLGFGSEVFRSLGAYLALAIRVLGFGLRGVQGLYRVFVLRVSGFGLGFQGSGFYGFSLL